MLFAFLCLWLAGACIYIYRAGTADGVDILERQAHFALAAKKVSRLTLPFAAVALLALTAAWIRDGRVKEYRYFAGRKQGHTMPPAGKTAGLSPYAYLLLFILAAMLLVLGIFNGGLKDVLIKAVNICTECIGLG